MQSRRPPSPACLSSQGPSGTVVAARAVRTMPQGAPDANSRAGCRLPQRTAMRERRSRVASANGRQATWADPRSRGWPRRWAIAWTNSGGMSCRPVGGDRPRGSLSFSIGVGHVETVRAGKGCTVVEAILLLGGKKTPSKTGAVRTVRPPPNPRHDVAFFPFFGDHTAK